MVPPPAPPSPLAPQPCHAITAQPAGSCPCTAAQLHAGGPGTLVLLPPPVPQRRLMEAIESQNVHDNFETALEHNPEAFSSVCML